jgi:hypothetical protein
MNVTNSISYNGVQGHATTIQSTIASSPTFINYTGPVANEGISYINFTDVYATATPVPFYGPVLLNYNPVGYLPTLTRTQGIKNVSPASINRRQAPFYNGL